MARLMRGAEGGRWVVEGGRDVAAAVGCAAGAGVGGGAEPRAGAVSAGTGGRDLESGGGSVGGGGGAGRVVASAPSGYGSRLARALPGRGEGGLADPTGPRAQARFFPPTARTRRRRRRRCCTSSAATRASSASRRVAGPWPRSVKSAPGWGPRRP